jgi:hypothetical protein
MLRLQNSLLLYKAPPKATRRMIPKKRNLTRATGIPDDLGQ